MLSSLWNKQFKETFQRRLWEGECLEETFFFSQMFIILKQMVILMKGFFFARVTWHLHTFWKVHFLFRLWMKKGSFLPHANAAFPPCLVRLVALCYLMHRAWQGFMPWQRHCGTVPGPKIFMVPPLGHLVPLGKAGWSLLRPDLLWHPWPSAPSQWPDSLPKVGSQIVQFC